ELIWNHYCDWYLELCKPALQGGTAVRQRGVQHTLAAVLEEMLRLAHPFMPFLTEEIWQALAPVAGKSDATIMTQPYPQPQEEKIDAAAETKIGRVIEIVQAIRKLRSEHHIAPRQGISLSLKQEDTTIELPKGEEFDYLIMAMTNTFSFDGSNPAQTREVTSVVSGIRITLSIDSKIGIAEELERTEKELAELMHRLAHSTAKLANAGFVNKAPAAVVEKERARKAELETKCAEMTKKRDDLRAQM
ncbi:MAG: class I tRNA ligase family protein, partial [Gammaproteobacteria bacterium]|nr:class I tRNA ligase family protein [Gammaproteobacteria bacterium]